MSLGPAAACLCLDTSCWLGTAPLTWPSLAGRTIPPLVEHIVLVQGILTLELGPLCAAVLTVQLAPQVLDLLAQVSHRLAPPHRLCSTTGRACMWTQHYPGWRTPSVSGASSAVSAARRVGRAKGAPCSLVRV